MTEKGAGQGRARRGGEGTKLAGSSQMLRLEIPGWVPGSEKGKAGRLVCLGKALRLAQNAWAYVGVGGEHGPPLLNPRAPLPRFPWASLLPLPSPRCSLSQEPRTQLLTLPVPQDSHF